MYWKLAIQNIRRSLRDYIIYFVTLNPSLLTIPKRKQQVAEILKEAETYIWRIKEEMRCA